ncbi:hypothetical protein GNI_036190 [Gregarina niphandrodes]|uniref:Uncharacterized protein n=1 Tax=Gregarina niphandrodes TaxID=110365 RepID=A0A023BAP9_GRENI|nr:hypothetical protein GNI_036190 [Gregarina niphandrodes]EZG78453.1 hypothetical protein GNI_036190 [Gregarina niphandrodes]|eukprot:XP_011129301.1 hypothetical protein GNI_036190 [Gregarina niphandrodes]
MKFSLLYSILLYNPNTPTSVDAFKLTNKAIRAYVQILEEDARHTDLLREVLAGPLCSLMSHPVQSIIPLCDKTQQLEGPNEYEFTTKTRKELSKQKNALQVAAMMNKYVNKIDIHTVQCGSGRCTDVVEGINVAPSPFSDVVFFKTMRSASKTRLYKKFKRQDGSFITFTLPEANMAKGHWTWVRNPADGSLTTLGALSPEMMELPELVNEQVDESAEVPELEFVDE